MFVTRDLKALRQSELPERVHPSAYENLPLALARYEFLSIVDEEEQEVRETLLETVFPLLEPALVAVPPGLLELHPEDLRSWPGAVDWFYKAKDEGQPETVLLADALGAWAISHNLAANWIVDAALRTMIAWQQNPELRDNPEWFSLEPDWSSALSPEEQSLEIKWKQAWEPTLESKDSARERLKEDAQKRIDDFLDKSDKLAEERSYVKPPKRRVPSRHLRWLVRHQVVGQSITEIAEDLQSDDPKQPGRKGVANGVHNAAELVGLELREPDKRGPAKAAKR